MDKITNQLNLAPELLDLLMEPYGYGRTLTLRHLPVFEREVYIEITPPRGRSNG